MTRFTLVRFLQTYAVLIMILILMLALSLASDSFLSAQNLLNILTVDPFYRDLTTGLIILAAIGISASGKRGH